jgi:hypothetical protein
LDDKNAIVSIYDTKKFNSTKDQVEYKYYTIRDEWKFASNNLLKDITNRNEIWLGITNENSFHKFLKSHSDIKIILKRGQYFKVAINHSDLKKLQAQNFINFIEFADLKPKSEATVLDLNLHPNRINILHHLYPNINGNKKTIGIHEPFYDINDIDIANRYIESGFESDFIDGHPLQMATIMVGNGNSFVTGKGVAYNALHTSSTNENLIPVENSFYNNLEINIQNHSYGTQIESFYGVEAYLYDQNVYDLDKVLHVFSSGNTGMETAKDGHYQLIEGFANITGNFKQSKNTLLVGAIDTANNILDYISNGPAYDGRIKPELVAYSMAGSSNSAALVSGTSLLLSDFYEEENNEVPSAALLKSILINSADDVHHKGPDFKTGYGQLDALKAMEIIEQQHFIEDEVDENGLKENTITIPEGAINFKATLSWTDLPANPNDGIALVNDLDFFIKTENDNLYFPWVLDATPNRISLNTPATKGEDHLNNTEQILIENPEGSSITFSVKAADLGSEFQKFSIAYQWEFPNQFEWTSPTASDNIPYNGSTTSHLRWESTFAEEIKGNLYYKAVHEDNWNLIKENVSLKQEQFRWEAPSLQDMAQLKMEIEGENFLSDTFTLSTPIQLKTGFNCSDSLSLYWNRLENATHYEINHVVEGKIINLNTTQDTTLVIGKTKLKSPYLQLIPFIEERPLIQSFTIDYNLQGSSCFLNSFFTEAVQDDGVLINLNLSSLSGISEVLIERKGGNGNWQSISQLIPNSLNFEILDEEPNTGFNDYRATILFENGASILSDISTVYYVQDSKYKLFPNPFLGGEDLNVFSKEVDIPATIKIINSSGKIFYTQTLETNRNYLELDALAEGLYIYHILKDDELRQSGKILKLE